MKFIIAKKQEMTQIWQNDKVIAVTKVVAEPCQITQLKTKEKDGYEAVQLGGGSRKTKNIAKPQIGHLKKANIKTDGNRTLHKLREFRAEGIIEGLELGDIVSVETFSKGDKIQVTGYSKGRGFQGVVKRHGFKGADEQHGNKDQSRMPGSAGATGPAHVFKGTRMGGRMGNDRVTMKTLEVIEVDVENNVLYIKGGIPGARNGLILVAGEGELKVEKAVNKKQEIDDSNLDKKKEDEKAEIAEEVKTVESAQSATGVATESLTSDSKSETPEQVEKEVVEAKEKVEAKKEEDKK